MQLLLPALRADFTLFETYGYTAEPPLSYPTTAIRGLQDPQVCCNELEAW
ncbi:hypothetical protein IQ268_28515 [Oculatella sp. LEGE 06141]|nr:hypothetical protein [Oculatella sp. LEGE 06141]MBE9182498.1 hypothetical protein [Oculatella sp. LEGE 06141]